MFWDEVLIPGVHYEYNPDTEVEELYRKAIDNQGTPEEYALLTRNFVGEEGEVLKLSQEIAIKHSENIWFDEKSKLYITKEAGYISYKENQLTLYPLLHINAQKSKCFVIVPLQSDTIQVLYSSLIVNMLNRFRIQKKIPDAEHAVVECFKANKGGSVLVAKGREPFHGRSEKIDLLINVEMKAGKETSEGKIDYKERGYAINIEIGDELATYEPSIEPMNGIDIYNHPIEASLKEIDTCKLGSGVKIDLDEKKVIADIDGVLEVTEDKKISVKDTLIINGDVDLSIGHLDVKGSLKIMGDVQPGIKIKAKGGVFVQGNIEEADLQCGGSLQVSGGVIGNEHTEIIVGGSVNVGFIRNGNVKAVDDVLVQQFLMNSNIITNGHIRTLDMRRGKVVGGKLSGFQGISVHIVGNPNNIKTQLIVGLDIERNRQVKLLNAKIKDNDNTFHKLKNALGSGYFQAPDVFIKRLPKHKIPIIKQVVDDLKQAIQEKKQLQLEYDELQQDDPLNNELSVTILSEAFAGTSVQIGNHSFDLKQDIVSPTRYLYDFDQRQIIPTAVKEQ